MVKSKDVERVEFEREPATAGVREEHSCDDLANLVVATCCEYHQYKRQV